MNHSAAERIALDAFTWLCAEQDLLPVFLNASGASVGDLRAALSSAEGPDQALLGAVLDFILMRDDTVIACCAAQNLPNDRLAQAQAVLAGHAGMHWT
ncbi:DUF3572 domain-containing protein [Roseinatronobacter alkalisoli]|uniref:DUF3572 domain-containing protein n=1 Tax=Roseinatronobacter alkalisoli TaxID=3028235 RepID=A0ABT5T3J0_9RHOB|nr:DUF3572 domain-containing protein [Roseinatronobacter sp. HJB301]MDD7969574.1 DUF3572 domain-containing protein [Roseinatronobacter sp. HJB301]